MKTKKRKIKKINITLISQDKSVVRERMRTRFWGLFDKKLKIHPVCFLALIMTAVIRVMLQTALPIYMRPNWMADDGLYVYCAKQLLKTGWLGEYCQYTLNKMPSFTFFLALIKLLEIPYMMALGLLYALASLVFFFAIRRVVKRDWIAFICYVYTLFTPIMYYDKITQVYRNSIIPAFVLLVVSSYLILYTDRNKSIKRYWFWSIICSLSFAFFWLIREDSIWLGCFVFGAIVLIIGKMIVERRQYKLSWQRILCVILPIFVCFGYVQGIKCVNYAHYGLYVLTDFDDTYSEEVIGLIKTLSNDDGTVCSSKITLETREKLYEVSPTFASIKEELEGLLDTEGAATPTWLYWNIRWAASAAGQYKDAVETNAFYKAIYDELSLAIEEGYLEVGENDLLYSSGVGNIQKSSIKKRLEAAIQGFLYMVEYKHVESVAHEVGSYGANLEDMEWITSSNAYNKESYYYFYGWTFALDENSTITMQIVGLDGELIELTYSNSPEVYSAYPDYENAQECGFKYLGKNVDEDCQFTFLLDDEVLYSGRIADFKEISDARIRTCIGNNSGFINNYATYGDPNQAVETANKIIAIYQKSGFVIFVLAMVAFVLELIKNIYNLFKKKRTNIAHWLIKVGMLSTILVDCFGVGFYAMRGRWRGFVTYTAGIYTIWNVFVCLCFFWLGKEIVAYCKKKNFSWILEKRFTNNG